jgi:hypothetical protein
MKRPATAAASIDPIERWSWVLALAAGVLGLALVSPLFAASLAVGAALEAANFRGLRRSATELFGGGGGARRWGAAFGLRFVLLALAIAVALHAGVHPVGLVVGLSLIIPAAVIEAWRTRPRVDTSAPALAPDDEEWERWNAWLARERPPEEDDDA